MLLHIAIEQFPPDTVFAFVTDKDRIVGVMAAQRLMTDPDLAQRTFEYAVELAGRKNSWHRELAAFILGDLCPPELPYKDEAVPILESMARDTKPAVRGAAMSALGRLRSVSSKGLILAALDDADAGVVSCASYALWAIGRTKADQARLRAAVSRFDKKTREGIDLWDD
jgi:HEAT repeat protein